MTLRRLLLLAAVLGSLGAAGLTRCGRAARDTLPASLSDQAFWQVVESMSEEGGYFRSDNLLSNEDSFQRALPALQERVPRDRVYIGVGPEQNFTYLVEMEPRIAFILDIRRQNLLLHLLYKALIEQSADRIEFLSRLFSRPRPPALSSQSTARELFDTYRGVSPSPEQFEATLGAVLQRLTSTHGFPLSEQDRAGIRYVYQAFYDSGPDLRYGLPRAVGGGRFFPSYAELLSATDETGTARSYLADDGRFARLKRYQERNLVVPLVGDFAGPHALQALGRYLRTHRSTVGLFYTSNVEQYLFQQADGWTRFAANMRALPVDEHSLILRSRFAFGGGYGRQGFGGFPPRRSVMVVDVIPELLRVARTNGIHSYADVLARAQPLPPSLVQ